MELEEMQELLPEIVCEIADLIGFEATQRLIAKIGGTRIVIGRGVHVNGRERHNILKDAVGKENLDILTNHFAGSEVYIPRCEAALKEFRNQQFLVEFKCLLAQNISASMAITKLCPKYEVTDRFAWRLLRKQKQVQSTSQGDLF